MLTIRYRVKRFDNNPPSKWEGFSDFLSSLPVRICQATKERESIESALEMTFTSQQQKTKSKHFSASFRCSRFVFCLFAVTTVERTHFRRRFDIDFDYIANSSKSSVNSFNCCPCCAKSLQIRVFTFICSPFLSIEASYEYSTISAEENLH